MGSSQSSPSAQNETQDVLVERLNALQLREKIRQQEVDSGYIDVDLDPPPYTRASRTLSVAAAEEWEKHLLSDPKVWYSGQV